MAHRGAENTVAWLGSMTKISSQSGRFSPWSSRVGSTSTPTSPRIRACLTSVRAEGAWRAFDDEGGPRRSARNRWLSRCGDCFVPHRGLWPYPLLERGRPPYQGRGGMPGNHPKSGGNPEPPPPAVRPGLLGKYGMKPSTWVGPRGRSRPVSRARNLRAIPARRRSSTHLDVRPPASGSARPALGATKVPPPPGRTSRSPYGPGAESSSRLNLRTRSSWMARRARCPAPPADLRPSSYGPRGWWWKVDGVRILREGHRHPRPVPNQIGGPDDRVRIING